MRNLILKPEFSLLTISREDPANGGDASTTSALTKALLLVRRITGVFLGGVGVTVVIGNLLISGSLLVRGPEFVIELLAK